jgi:T5SS/PEP-CTERM-associated repeat protein
MMKRSTVYLTMVFVAFALAVPLEPAWATITGNGDVFPNDPTTWTSDTEGYVGKVSDGSLTVNGGSDLVSYRANLGALAGVSGVVTVTDHGSTWTNTDSIAVGKNGNGKLNVTNGGVVITDYCTLSHDALGVATVSGGGSSLEVDSYLHVGGWANSTGTLSVTDGAHVTSGGIIVAYDYNSTGTITVAGAGSLLTADRDFCTIGSYGDGALTVRDGGTVRSLMGMVSSVYEATGEATVTGPGSTWTNTLDLFVGHQGSGSLTITDGGLVSVGQLLTIRAFDQTEGFINMSSGGMLALLGNADGSLDEFLDLIAGSDDIRYWDDSITDWAPITSAMPDVDYTVKYIGDPASDLHGYTVLTVGTIPEPGILVALLIGAFTLTARRPQR